jgi:hypothetical protein
MREKMSAINGTTWDLHPPKNGQARGRHGSMPPDGISKRSTKMRISNNIQCESQNDIYRLFTGLNRKHRFDIRYFSD